MTMSGTKPEDSIAEGGRLACLQPPVFFDQSGERAPAVAFYPNPAGIADAEAPLIDAHLTLEGRHGVARLVKADVHQLSGFLLEMLDIAEPTIEPLPAAEVRAALSAVEAKAILSSEVSEVRKAFRNNPQRASDLLCDFFKGIDEINHRTDSVRQAGPGILLGAVRRWMDDFLVRREAAFAAHHAMLDSLDRPMADLLGPPPFRFAVRERVRLLEDMPEQGVRGLKAGQLGEVVHVFRTDGIELLEVRFTDDRGHQLAYVTMGHKCVEPAP
jgi:hypothetical protein